METKREQLNIFRKLFLFSVFAFAFVVFANSVSADWQCSAPYNNSAYDYLKSLSPQLRAQLIRGDVPATGDYWYWGSNCVVGCSNTASCGDCECRCRGAELYCADRWIESSSYLSQSCRRDDLGSNKCKPYANITAPANNAVFAQGANINFNTDASDGNGESLSYRWVLRTNANNAASNYTQDVEYNSRSLNINNLAPDGYHVYLNVGNKQGVWTGWKWVIITVAPKPTCATSFTPSTFTAPGTTQWIKNTTNTTKTDINCTGVLSAYTSIHNSGINGTWPITVNSAGTGTCNITVTGPGGTGTCSASLTTTAPTSAPTLNFYADPSNITLGESSTLYWSTQNASHCLASGEWTGVEGGPLPGLRPANGQQVVTPTSVGTKKYYLECGDMMVPNATSGVKEAIVNVIAACAPNGINTCTGSSSTVEPCDLSNDDCPGCTETCTGNKTIYQAACVDSCNNSLPLNQCANSCRSENTTGCTCDAGNQGVNNWIEVPAGN